MVYRILSFTFAVIFSLSSALYAGAGVLLMFDDHTLLLGEEVRSRVKIWSDCGGKQDPQDNGDNRRTALREGNEETANTFGLTYGQLAGAPSINHHHHVGSYEMFFVRIPGSKPSIQELIKNGRDRKGNLLPHVEKTNYAYVDAQQLINAAWGNGFLPGTTAPLFPPFKACIKNDTRNPAASVLYAFLNSPKKAASLRPLPTKAPSKLGGNLRNRHALTRKLTPRIRTVARRRSFASKPRHVRLQRQTRPQRHHFHCHRRHVFRLRHTSKQRR